MSKLFSSIASGLDSLFTAAEQSERDRYLSASKDSSDLERRIRELERESTRGFLFTGYNH